MYYDYFCATSLLNALHGTFAVLTTSWHVEAALQMITNVYCTDKP